MHECGYCEDHCTCRQSARKRSREELPPGLAPTQLPHRPAAAEAGRRVSLQLGEAAEAEMDEAEMEDEEAVLSRSLRNEQLHTLLVSMAEADASEAAADSARQRSRSLGIHWRVYNVGHIRNDIVLL